MQLINETRFAGHLFRGVADEEQIHATLVIRSAFRVSARGVPTPWDPPMDIHLEPREIDGVPGEDDGAPVKGGVDICVFGSARPPRGVVRTMSVRIAVGSVERTLQVTGDRAWVPRPGANLDRAARRARDGHFDLDVLVATPPEPFASMPMSWSRSFGGRAQTEQGEIPYGPNPFGRGFLLGLEGAAGTKLPNFEDPSHPVSSWRDTPLPACFAPCPRASKLRTDRGVAMDAKGTSFQILPAYFNVAHPWLVFETLAPETPIRVEGMSSDPVFEFRMPFLQLTAEVFVGEHRVALPLRTDTVDVYPSEGRLALVSRAAFRYHLRAGEERMARVFEAKGASR